MEKLKMYEKNWQFLNYAVHFRKLDLMNRERKD
jgi:hypothetical protein